MGLNSLILLKLFLLIFYTYKHMLNLGLFFIYTYKNIKLMLLESKL